MKTVLVKFVIFVGCLIMLLGVIGIGSLTVSADNPTSGTCGDNLTWEYNESTYTLTIYGTGEMNGYSSDYNKTAPWKSFYETMKTVVINDGVTSIGNYAFYECTELTSISLPDSITSIGQHAFYNCSNLTNIIIPNEVENIGNWAFYSCSGLVNITISNSISSIGYRVFSYCTSLTSIIIPNSVETIGDYAFSNCTRLKNLTIPNGVKTIKQGAFYNCSELTTVTVPDSVTNIGYVAFKGCNSLTEITLPFIGEYDGINGYAYNNVFGYIFGYVKKIPAEQIPIGCVYQYQERLDEWPYYNTYYYYIPASLRKVTITNTATIPCNAFKNCSFIENLTLPDNVTSISGDSIDSNITINCNADSVSAFSLSKVGYSFVDPDALDYRIIIHGNAEEKYVEIAEYIGVDKQPTIPSGVRGIPVSVIGDYAFYNCAELTNVTIPSSVTNIWSSAFEGCTKLSNIIIPNSVISIGNSAFSGCTELTSVTIPGSVTSIGNSAFSNCNCLTSIAVNNNNPIYHSAGNCIIETESKTLIAGCNNSVIPTDGSVTSIGDAAFKYCTGLTSVTISNSVTSIGSGAFSGCTSLTSIIIPDSATSIGRSAFYGCTSLTNIIIPDSVTNIEDWVFYGCTGLASVTIGNGITNIASNTFVDCPLERVKMGSGLTSIPSCLINKETLKAFTVGENVTSIDASVFSDCTKLEILTFNAVNCSDFGSYRHWLSGCSSLKSVTIGNNVEKIPAYFLYGCQGITSITIPDSVTSIGVDAFYNCPLEYVKMGSGLTSIPSTLIHKDSLKTFIIGNSVTSIDSSAFKDCTALSSVTIGNSVKKIDDSAFFGCTGLTSIVISNSVTSIGKSTFSNCSGLTSVRIGTSVTTISDSLFAGCTSLATITLPSGITRIGENAFYNTAYYNNASNWTDNLLYIGNYLIKGKTDLTGNKSVKSGTTCIADYALSGCNKFITLTVPNSVNYIGSNAFGNVTNVAYTGTATGSPWGARCLNGYTDGNFVYSDSGKAKLVACSGLATGSVIIPASTDTIGNSAFSACSTLTNIYIPVNVTRIGNSAFSSTALSDVYYEGSTVDKLGISFGDYNSKITDATWHYNSKKSDMPSTPANPDNPTNPDNPSLDIPEANVIRGNSADNKKTYNYRTTVTFTANVTEGGSVQWYVDGNPAGNGNTLTVKDKTNDYTVKVIVTDRNGNKIMDEEQVTIKHGFFDILIWFFVHLFNPGAYDVKQ